MCYLFSQNKKKMVNYVGHRNMDRGGADIWCRHNQPFNGVMKACSDNKNCKSFIYAESMNHLGCIKGPKVPGLSLHRSVTTYDKE